MVKRWAVMAVVSVLVQGCGATTRPPGSVGFSRARSLTDFEGVYRNLGEVGGNAPTTYLSALIWPGDASLAHPLISTIEVRAEGTEHLRVVARQDTLRVREQTFTRGREFELRAGRLRIRHRVGRYANSNPGDPLLGMQEQAVELGVDRRGAGKSRETWNFLGLVYLVMPMGFSDVRETRFVRIGD